MGDGGRRRGGRRQGSPETESVTLYGGRAEGGA